MPIDFKRMNDGFAQQLDAVQVYRTAKDMLRELAKYLPMRVPLAKWKQIDTEMDGEPTHRLLDVFQRVTQYDFRWSMGLLPKPAINPAVDVILTCCSGKLGRCGRVVSLQSSRHLGHA